MFQERSFRHFIATAFSKPVKFIITYCVRKRYKESEVHAVKKLKILNNSGHKYPNIAIIHIKTHNHYYVQGPSFHRLLFANLMLFFSLSKYLTIIFFSCWGTLYFRSTCLVIVSLIKSCWSILPITYANGKLHVFAAVAWPVKISWRSTRVKKVHINVTSESLFLVAKPAHHWLSCVRRTCNV